MLGILWVLVFWFAKFHKNLQHKFLDIFEFLQKGIIMHELVAGLNADKFATFWMLPTSFYYSFVLQMTFIHSTTG